MVKSTIIIILFIINLISTYNKDIGHQIQNEIQQKLKQNGIQRHDPQNIQIQQQDNEIQQQRRQRILQQESEIDNIRVTIDFTRLDNITNITYKQGITESLLIAQNFVQQVFKVYPEIYTIVVQDQPWTNGYESICTSVLNEEQIYLEQSDVDPGIGISDLHIYTVWEENEEAEYLSRADVCQWVNDRPLVGYIKFNISWFIKWYTSSGSDFTYISENVIHQFLHILGFGINNIPYFRTIEGKKMTQEELDQILTKKTIRGKETPILKSQHVVRHAKEHFGCEDLEGMQLENDIEIGMHWEQTIMFNDIMNPEGVKTKTYISDITLAYFLDTHWYADVDLTKSEKSLWGQNKGCTFLEDCDHTQFDEFSDGSLTDSSCTLDKYSKSIAQVTDYSDGCYIQSQIQNGNCFDILSVTDEQAFTYEEYGEYSRCFESTFVDPTETSSLQSRCYNHYCDLNEQQLIIEIEVNGDKKQVICGFDEEGQIKSAPDATLNGNLICPKNIEKLCNDEYPVPCDTHCYAKGFCLFRDNKAVCQCIDSYAGERCNEQCTALLSSEGNLCLEGDVCANQGEYFDGTKKCYECHENCTFCDGPSENDCRNCQQGTFSYNESCVTTCQNGMFTNLSTGECEDCDSSCKDGCNGSKYNCIISPIIDSGMSIIDFNYQQLLKFNIIIILIIQIYIL